MPEKTLQQVSRQARDFYDKGMTAIERNAMDTALEYLCRACAAEPGFLKGHQLLRKAQIKKYKSGGAMNKMMGSVTGSGALAKAQMVLAKDPAKAMEYAEQALNNNPFNLPALKVLSQAAEALQFWVIAVNAFETAREANPNSIEVLLYLGRLYQEAGMSEKGIECFEKVMEIDPPNAEAFGGLKNAQANLSMERGNWQGSYRDNIANVKEAEELENASRVFKEEDVIRGQMAEIYKRTQEGEGENVTHWKKLGDYAVQINEFDHAVDYYTHALGLTQGADGNIEKLVSETKIKKLAFAIKQKEDALAADPQNAALQEEIAELNRQREKAIMEDCEARSQRYPNDLDLKFDLARIYLKNNLVDEAIREFQTASNNPKNKIACVNYIAQCFRLKGILDLAVQRFKAAAEACLVMDGLKKDILYNLGSTYEQWGKPADAIEQYKLIYDADVSFRDVGKKIEDYYRSQSGQA